MASGPIESNKSDLIYRAIDYLRDSMYGSVDAIRADGTTGREPWPRDPEGIEIAKWIVTELAKE